MSDSPFMKFKFSAFFIIFLLLLWILGQVPRVEFWYSFFIYSLLFGLYILLFRWAHKLDLKVGHILLIALLSRLVFMGLPLHSDDFYRFYWDGHLLLNQINPYEFTPKELMDLDKVPISIKPVYDNLNSQHYHSIYPVTNQSVFAFAAWMGGQHVLGFTLWVRFILVIFEMITIWVLFKLLTQMRIDPSHTLLYALNPLVILEITANLHFEGLMVAFIFLGFLSLLHRKNIQSGGWIGTAISIKLTPLILFPLFLKLLYLRKFIWFASTLTLTVIIFFLPILLSGTIIEYFTSIQLYYGTFEFNASIYYVLRELGYLIKGYNMIGDLSRVLSIIAFVSICYIAWKAKMDDIQHLIFFSIAVYFIYLILSMVVHPWYIIPLIALGVLGRMKYPLLWSYLIYLSYYAYAIVPYSENYVLIGIQYGLLAIFAIAEYTTYLRSKNHVYLKS
jgi:alpha-1,6-mannosyltransferase